MNYGNKINIPQQSIEIIPYLLTIKFSTDSESQIRFNVLHEIAFYRMRRFIMQVRELESCVNMLTPATSLLTTA